jgi:hypothetical protein
LFPDEPAVRPDHRGQGVALVRIERDILHVSASRPTHVVPCSDSFGHTA